jgi:putative ABC transport system substrate-binding protein
MTGRRAFVVAVALALTPRFARPQSAAAKPRIAYLGGGESANFHALFARALAARGARRGEAPAVENRFYEGSAARAQELAAELVRTKPAVIVAIGTAGAVAVRDATKAIPVVFALASDPVGNRLVVSLARPGRNMTGVAFDPAPDVAPRMIELLVEAAPGVRTIAVVANPQMPGFDATIAAARKAAPALGVRIQSTPITPVEAIDEAFAALAKGGAQGIVVVQDPWLVAQQKTLVERAAEHRLPAIYRFRSAVEAGGLMSYGPSVASAIRDAAGLVDRILDGAKPRDLPVLPPAAFDLAVNAKTAQALGLALPPALVARADAVVR